MIDDPNTADAAALIREVEEALALELGNSGTGCPHWLADIYTMLDAALRSLGDPERSTVGARRIERTNTSMET